MVHLLEALVQEPGVVKALAREKENTEQGAPRLVGGAGARSYASPDLRSLRERLLTTVAASSVLGQGGDRGRRRGVLEDRPLLTEWVLRIALLMTTDLLQ